MHACSMLTAPLLPPCFQKGSECFDKNVVMAFGGMIFMIHLDSARQCLSTLGIQQTMFLVMRIHLHNPPIFL